MAIKSQGTQLFILDNVGSGAADIVTIACATGISGLGGARDQLDSTCLEDDARSFEAGLMTPSALSVTVNLDFADASHFRIYELWKSGENVPVAIGLGDGTKTIVPTIGSDGQFDFPITRTFIAFEAYVADVPLDIPLNGFVNATVSLQPSGAYNVFPKL